MSATERDDELSPALLEANQLGAIAAEHSAAHGEQKEALSETIHQGLDHLIDDLLCRFPHAPASVAEVKPVLENQHDLTRESLADVEEGVIPLAIIRELVSRHKLVVRQQSVPAWPRFVDRYRAVCYA